MEKKENTPLWVFLAFSSISTRKGASVLIFSCLIFSVYCIPWSQFFVQQEWVSTLFLIDDWSWVAMMVPIVIWYLLSLKWMDKNLGWDD
ncbi:MAG: hypothetical protein ACJA2O_002900 [Candidatus Azotimanducaceae bacterium]|jgi:hypothetical protein